MIEKFDETTQEVLKDLEKYSKEITELYDLMKELQNEIDKEN